METFLIKALQLILSLSILVIVHEFGHFIFARIFKVRVEKFYLFFDPWFSLFKYKPKNSDTEYGVGWLPLGGYCKISGMIDESMDKEAMAQPPKPYEFRSKPAGQRLMIMVAGVVFNFLLALFIYSMILFTWGDTYLPLKNMKMGMNYSETFQNVGFQDGDILLRADNEELERFGSDSFRKVVEAKTVTVLRDGRETVISIPEDMMQRCMRDGKGFADPLRIPMVVRELPDKNAPAALAGMLHSLEEKEIYVSAGSACSSNKPAPSKTLQGIGLKKADLEGTIRFSFCVNTTEAEIDYAIEQLKEIIPFRRKFTRH